MKRIELILYNLNQKYGGNFYGKWRFFKVENSEYLKWLSKQSHTISDDRKLKHFSFLGEYLLIDVINPSEPIVEFVK